jgi:hypothetical protein
VKGLGGIFIRRRKTSSSLEDLAMVDDTPFTQETNQAIFGLGFFVAAWSVLEATLEVAISQQLNLSALDSSHITAGMQFKPKTVMLKSLLNRDKAKNAKAIDVVNNMQKRGERNDLLHGVVGFNLKELVFTRRRNDKGRFTSEEKPYTGEQLIQLSHDVADLSAALKAELHISDTDYETWLQEAHRDANKAG